MVVLHIMISFNRIVMDYNRCWGFKFNRGFWIQSFALGIQWTSWCPLLGMWQIGSWDGFSSKGSDSGVFNGMRQKCNGCLCNGYFSRLWWFPTKINSIANAVYRSFVAEKIRSRRWRCPMLIKYTHLSSKIFYYMILLMGKTILFHFVVHCIPLFLDDQLT